MVWSSGNPVLSSVVRVYSVTVLLGGILSCAMLRWQPWITRPQRPSFVRMGPAIATVIARMTRRWITPRRILSCLAALPPLLLNQRRPLLGEAPGIFIDGYYLPLVPNIFDSNVWQKNVPGNTPEYIVYREAVARIVDRAAGGVGLMPVGNSVEYPFWRMLPKTDQRCRFILNMYAYSTIMARGQPFSPKSCWRPTVTPPRRPSTAAAIPAVTA